MGRIDIVLTYIPMSILFPGGDCETNISMDYRFCKVNAQSGGFFPGTDIFVDSFRLYFKVWAGYLYVHIQGFLRIMDNYQARRGLFPTVERNQGSAEGTRPGEGNFVGHA